MKIENIKSIEDLENSGSITDWIVYLRNLIKPLTIEEIETYTELFEIVRAIQKNWLPVIDGPFISKQAEIIYYLTELDGKKRAEKLGLNDEHYNDKAKAKIWYQKLSNLVHPDKGGNKEAFSTLKKIYDTITDVEEDENV